MFTFIDLFAGVGGFRFAMEELGGECVFSSEIDRYARETYFSNFGEMPHGDITQKRVKASIPEEFDVLCGGFPCQAFSIAGKRKGFEDTRGTLFFEIEEIIKKHRPKVVFLENVKNILTHDKGNTFRVIGESFENLEYKMFFDVLGSSTHANIPQGRERAFFVCFDTTVFGDDIEFEFPEEMSLTTSVIDFLEKGKQEDKYYYKPSHGLYKSLSASVKSRDTVYQWRRAYVRENKSNLCPTLTANMGTGGHNVPIILDDYGIRKLTPKECFALQGFPMEKFTLPDIANCHLYKQSGNSVTVPLIKQIAEKIMSPLLDKSTRDLPKFI